MSARACDAPVREKAEWVREVRAGEAVSVLVYRELLCFPFYRCVGILGVYFGNGEWDYVREVSDGFWKSYVLLLFSVQY